MVLVFWWCGGAVGSGATMLLVLPWCWWWLQFLFRVVPAGRNSFLEASLFVLISLFFISHVGTDEPRPVTHSHYSITCLLKRLYTDHVCTFQYLVAILV